MAIPPARSRVEITGVMPNDPNPLPIGTRGTVTGANESAGQIYVDWDNDSRLMLLVSDPFRAIDPDDGAPALAGAGR